MEKITFITGNAGKAQYLRDFFHVPVTHKKLDLPEIQSLDLTEIVEDKAERAYAQIGTPVLVEDVSLTFTRLKALPGPLIKWFLETLGNDGLCKLIDTERAALAEVTFALYDGTHMHTFSGSAAGTIAPSPRGETNFGWDPIFIPNGSTKTWAEMSAEEKHQTSMRRPALEKLIKYLDKNS